MATSIPARHSFWFNLNDHVFHIDQKNLPVRAEQLRTRLAVYPALAISQVVLEFLFVWLFWEEA